MDVRFPYCLLLKGCFVLGQEVCCEFQDATAGDADAEAPGQEGIG